MVSLNPEQRAAVTHGDGHAIITAAPGSGKTRILAHRIAHLLERGTAPSSITAITFTNKAAGAIRSRVNALLGSSADGVNTGTFHAVGLRLLKDFGHLAGLPVKPTVLDADDARVLMRTALRNLGTEVSKASATLDYPRYLSEVIEHAKRGGLNARAFQEVTPRVGYSHTLPNELAIDAFLEYERLCRAQHAFDFDDLILEATKLLKLEAPRAAMRDACEHLIVDEFQDTSTAQYALTRALEANAVMVIGDPLQSIYGWRGATPDIFDRFATDHPPVTRYTVTTNYRSSTAILETASAAMRPSVNVTLRGARDRGEVVRVHHAQTAELEAEFIAQDIGFHALTRSFDDFAILLRASSLARPLERALAQHGIPYRLVGSSSYWNRIEVRVAVALLRLALNPLHEPALEYAVGEGLHFAFIPGAEKFSLGETSLEKLRGWARQHGQVLLEAFSPDVGAGLKPRASSAARWVYEVGLPSLYEQDRPEAFLRHALTLWGYQPYLEAMAVQGDADAVTRLESLQELYALAQRHEREGGTLESFAEVITLERSQQALAQGEHASAVTISTIHAAKGLEWDVVIIPGLDQGVFPSGGALKDNAVNDEERRVLFVALTRARDALVLTRAASRRINGEMTNTTPSMYLMDVRDHTLEVSGSGMHALTGSSSAVAHPAV